MSNPAAVPKAAIGTRDHILTAHKMGVGDNPVCDQLRVLHEIGYGVNDARISILPSGSLTSRHIFHSCACRGFEASIE